MAEPVSPVQERITAELRALGVGCVVETPAPGFHALYVVDQVGAGAPISLIWPNADRLTVTVGRGARADVSLDLAGLDQASAMIRDVVERGVVEKHYRGGVESHVPRQGVEGPPDFRVRHGWSRGPLKGARSYPSYGAPHRQEAEPALVG